MSIRFVEHARERIISRGTTEEEIEKVLISGDYTTAKKGRKAKEMVFEYRKEWLGKFYSQKKVVVIFVEENNEIVVITVKVFYGEWS